MDTSKFGGELNFLRDQYSVLNAIIQRVIWCTLFSVFIEIIHELNLFNSWPLINMIPNILLGLLLSFRTTTAYERFWEGRKLWGTLVNNVRNLSRDIWVTVEEIEQPKDRDLKVATLRLLVAFAVATKLHLRRENVNIELTDLMTAERYEKLKFMNNPPLEVAFWIGDYLQEQYERNCLDSYQLNALKQLLNSMVDCLGGCERIQKTPIPLAYAIHLKQILLIYCSFLPLQMVEVLHWLTIPMVALVSFILFGIEEIGNQLENPFGKAPNDLPLDAICATMRRNIEDLISLAPAVRNWKKERLTPLRD